MVSTHLAASQSNANDFSRKNDLSQQSFQANSAPAQGQGESFLSRANSLMSVPIVRTPSYDSLSSQISCSSLSLEDATPLYVEKTHYEPNFKGAQCFSWTFQQSRERQYSPSSSPNVATVAAPDSVKTMVPKTTDSVSNSSGIASHSGTKARAHLTDNTEPKKNGENNKGAKRKSASVPGQMIRSGWRPEEDALIKKTVSAHKGGCFTQWSDIAQQMPNRKGKQVRDRWVNYLNPALDHKKFTQKDDLQLWRAVKVKGTRWSEISSEYFDCAKSENQLKNRWYSAKFRHNIKSHLLNEKNKVSNR